MCFFWRSGVGKGCFELNSTTVEFLPRLDQARCQVHRGDTAIGPYFWQVGAALNSIRVEFLPRFDRGKCSVDRRGTATGQSRHSWQVFFFPCYYYYYFFWGGGGRGRGGRGRGALNSTMVEFIPRLYRGRYPADRKDTAIGQSRHFWQVGPDQ